MIDLAVILASGNPAHQSHLVQTRSQAMLPALGKPLVARVMNNLYRFGVKNYIVVVGLEEGAVASYLNRQWVPDANIEFILTSPEKNLAGVLQGIAQKANKPFLLSAYNTFTHSRLLEKIMQENDATEQDLTLVGAKQTLSKSTKQYYAILQDNRVQEIRMQPTANNICYTLGEFGICGTHFVEFLQTFDIKKTPALATSSKFINLVQQYQQQPEATIKIQETSWILQVETDFDLLTLNKRLLEEGYDAHILSEFPNSVHIIPPVRIDPLVSIGQGATIGPYVYLENGSSVGLNSRVSNAMVLSNGSIAANQTIQNAIIATNSIIRE